MEESKTDFYIGYNLVNSSRNAIVTKRLPDIDASGLTTPFIKVIPENKRQNEHCIILYLPTLLAAIQLWNSTVITLGRYDKHLHIQPVVDLSDHHALLLGVSRLHAEITYEKSNYYVRDLNSKNGTWVNTTKLIADEKIQLVNKDTLRLAHLIIQVSSHEN